MTTGAVGVRTAAQGREVWAVLHVVRSSNSASLPDDQRLDSTKLVAEWSPRLSPSQIAEKVKLFFFEYARNRHKMTTLTPSYHAVRQHKRPLCLLMAG
jgi:hypothetical protein